MENVIAPYRKETFKSENLELIREQFPILKEYVNNHPLVYLDNGATSQKPIAVIKAIENYYSAYNSNVHRGVHTLSQVATEKLESVRKRTQVWLNAKVPEEIIFTKGTTDGINLVANSYGHRYVNAGDEIIVTRMEHHSNIVPWQLLCERYNAKLRVLDMDSSGQLKIESLNDLINDKTKLIAITHVSNALGTINPIKEIISKYARPNNIHVLVDGAQASPHMYIDVQDLDADFYAFSSHKMYGPTGVGVLYGKAELLNEIPPYQGGGDMIKEVTFEKTTYNDLPYKFEAGTPNIAGIIGFGAALEFLETSNFEEMKRHEENLLSYTSEALSSIQGVKIIGTAKKKTSILSFNIEGIHPYDIGSILDQLGIAVRTGHHCTQPIMDFYKIPGTIRASFAAYNNIEDADTFIQGLNQAISMLR